MDRIRPCSPDPLVDGQTTQDEMEKQSSYQVTSAHGSVNTSPSRNQADRSRPRHKARCWVGQTRPGQGTPISMSDVWLIAVWDGGGTGNNLPGAAFFTGCGRSAERATSVPDQRAGTGSPDLCRVAAAMKLRYRRSASAANPAMWFSASAARDSMAWGPRTDSRASR